MLDTVLVGEQLETVEFWRVLSLPFQKKHFSFANITLYN